MIIFPGRHLMGVLECHQLTHLQIRWWNWKPMSYDVNTMDALIVSIQIVLVGRIIHPAKFYVYSLLLENEPTSIYSHLTRKEKWKLWVGWHGSSCWLLCLCVLYFVFCAASKTIQCSQVSPYLIFWKMKIMSYVFRRVSLSIKLRPEKITIGKIGTIQLSGRRLEQISDNHLLCQNTNTNYHRKKLRPEKKVQSSGRRLE